MAFVVGYTIYDIKAKKEPLNDDMEIYLWVYKFQADIYTGMVMIYGRAALIVIKRICG